jgi:hypothetical protein
MKQNGRMFISSYLAASVELYALISTELALGRQDIMHDAEDSLEALLQKQTKSNEAYKLLDEIQPKVSSTQTPISNIVHVCRNEPDDERKEPHLHKLDITA